MGRTPLSPEARQRVRDRLLEAAARVFEARGYQSARIEEIAREARVAVGTVYNYFPGKADLILELHYRRLLAVREEVESLVGGDGTFCDKVRAYVERFVSFSEQSRGFFETLRDSPRFLRDSMDAQGEKVQQIHAVLDRLMKGLGALMEQGVREGVLRPQEPDDLARALLGLSQGLALRRFQESLGLEDLSAKILDLFLHGAAMPGPSGLASPGCEEAPGKGGPS